MTRSPRSSPTPDGLPARPTPARRRTSLGRTTVPRPFVKWAGGKRQLLPILTELAPTEFGRYYEPFVGGGALYWALAPERAVLGDVNQRLVRTYRALQRDVDGVIASLAQHRSDSSYYYQMRDIDVDALSDVEVAAWLIYVLRVGFNGLYRVNASNRFNVPFGNPVNPRICDRENLRACAERLKRAEIRGGDFASVVADAEPRDFVYFDPPYVPLNRTSSFTSYAKGGFGPSEQERLRDLALDLKSRGVYVLLSNSSAPLVYELYGRDFEILEVEVNRYVGARADSRGAVKEVLIA